MGLKYMEEGVRSKRATTSLRRKRDHSAYLLVIAGLVAHP